VPLSRGLSTPVKFLHYDTTHFVHGLHGAQAAENNSQVTEDVLLPLFMSRQPLGESSTFVS
jgi:hypothetical protein